MVEWPTEANKVDKKYKIEGKDERELNSQKNTKIK